MNSYRICQIYVNWLTISQSAIKLQITAIQRQKERALAIRVAKGQKDADAINGAYRTLSYLFDAFQVSSGCTTLF